MQVPEGKRKQTAGVVSLRGSDPAVHWKSHRILRAMECSFNASATYGDDGFAAALRDVCGYIILPHLCMRECGAACRTFGVLLDLKNNRSRSLYHAVEKIAVQAGVRRSTAFRHLDRLKEPRHRKSEGWIERFRRPLRRRTCEVRITDSGWKDRSPYGVLPKWFPAAAPWSAAAVYSIVLNRWCGLETALAEQMDRSPEEHGVEPFFRFQHIARDTGLSLRSVQNGVEWLADHEITWHESDQDGTFFQLCQPPDRCGKNETVGASTTRLYVP